MSTALANAFPRKLFFMEMFTRDISLEDCILDLIDNSIDSLVRQKGIDPARDILKERLGPRQRKPDLPKVELRLDGKTITISDTCGGIPLDQVLTEIFTFGHDAKAQLGQLGAYGIGLKRAIFKIGEEFEITSHTDGGGFRASLNVDKWAEQDKTMDDWKIPVTFLKNGTAHKNLGTEIAFSRLREEVRMRLRDGAFEGRLTAAIAQTYALFLEDSVRVFLNGKAVEPTEIPVGGSSESKPGQVEFTKGEVKVRIFAALAARKDAEWAYERAGWYVLCNGRVVLPANKTELTGWGEGMPQFHSKYNGFVGVAVFRSRNPLALPWTTTKRGLNLESPVYQSAKIEMAILARPIISFLNDMYKQELNEEQPERRIAERVVQADIRRLASQRPTPFEVKTPDIPKRRP
jgi:Histidine kinase-, DNA gyrase B-, and HSP90-like ATPase